MYTLTVDSMTYAPRGKLATPTIFPSFPYQPYTIQQQLMEALFRVLDDGGVGIFESPTGTGKSLTLTCAALQWFKLHGTLVRWDLQRRIGEVELELGRLAANSDWMRAHHESVEQQVELHALQTMRKLLYEREQQLYERKEYQQRRAELAPKVQTQKQQSPTAVVKDGGGGVVEGRAAEQWREGDVEGDPEDNLQSTPEAEQRYRDVQIFFCSRTHSQLAQVVREIKRTPFGRDIRCVSLGSRQQLCINPQVRRLPSTALINERCLDMARNSTIIAAKTTATCDDDDGGGGCCARKKSRVTVAAPSSSKCVFKSPQNLQNLRETALFEMLDIEDLVREGGIERACPYYATRAATQDAQLIMLPYQMLLHRRTRLQSGIDLRGAVVIIDEAHNLLDTIAQLHSCELTLPQLQLAQQQIDGYKQRYATRFSTANLLRINQLLFVVRRLEALLQPKTATAKASTRMLRTYELTGEGDFFNIDLYALLAFCERSRLAQKLQAFAQRLSSEPRPNENQTPPPASAVSATGAFLRRLEVQQQQQQQQQAKQKRKGVVKKDEKKKREEGAFLAATPAPVKKPPPVLPHSQSSPIRPLIAFLDTLTEKATDGRVLVNVASEPSRSSFKYILLNPGAHFADVLRDARAIIVAGGTMQPTAELTSQLFSSCPERVQMHFYDHVVPSDAVLPFVVTRGPSGRQLCFNFAQRATQEMLSELGMILQNVCSVVPAGVVCFLPSYDYLNTFYAHLECTGLLARIAAKKAIFCEPRSTATGAGGGTQSVEQVLASYAAAIGPSSRQQSGGGGGALLLSVVGGKLSEGLNFADDLGRAVIVVGLPYPNRQSPELQERMKYLDATLGPNAGGEYYENLCMKAVNQCIGRSVRHILDYACVFLLDERYESERIRSKLPQWIGRSLQCPATFGIMQAATAKFFKAKRPS